MAKKVKKESQGDVSEQHFLWWLEELESFGLVKDIIHQPKEIVLFPPTLIYFEHKYDSKKVDIIKNRTLFQATTYIPDFSFLMHKNLLNKLFCKIIKTDNLNYIENDLELISGNVFENTIWYTTVQIDSDWFEIIVDVKPPASVGKFGKSSPPIIFSNKQKVIFNNMFLYVNKIVPAKDKNSLFTKTFMPKRYRFTDKDGTLRKLDQKYRLIDEYLKLKNIKPV